MSLAPFYLIALALIGVADTLYLSYAKFTNTTPSCLLEGCDVVLASPYANMLGIPLSYWGLVFYVYMLGLVILLAMEPRSKALRLATVAYTTIGLLMSGSFIYIQGVLIGAFCQYCVLSAIVSTALFAVAVWHLRSTKG